MNLETQTSAPSKRGKNEQIIEGCRKLQQAQRPGQCFTTSEIGRACGVHQRAVEFIVRRALYKVGTALAARDRGLLAEVFIDRSLPEIHGKIAALRDPYRTGKPPRRQKTTKHRVKPDDSLPSLTEVARILDSRSSAKKWGSKSQRADHRGLSLPMIQRRDVPLRRPGEVSSSLVAELTGQPRGVC